MVKLVQCGRLHAGGRRRQQAPALPFQIQILMNVPALRYSLSDNAAGSRPAYAGCAGCADRARCNRTAADDGAAATAYSARGEPAGSAPSTRADTRSIRRAARRTPGCPASAPASRRPATPVWKGQCRRRPTSTIAGWKSWLPGSHTRGRQLRDAGGEVAVRLLRMILRQISRGAIKSTSRRCAWIASSTA